MTNSTENSIFSDLSLPIRVTIIILSIFLVIGLAFIDSYVLSTLWGLFVVPTFFVMPLSYKTSYGICLIFSLLNHRESSYSTKVIFDKSSNIMYLARILFPLTILGFGYLVYYL